MFMISFSSQLLPKLWLRYFLFLTFIDQIKILTSFQQTSFLCDLSLYCPKNKLNPTAAAAWLKFIFSKVKMPEPESDPDGNSKSVSLAVIIRFKDQQPPRTKKETLQNVYLCISYTTINYKEFFWVLYVLPNWMMSRLLPHSQLDIHVGAGCWLLALGYIRYCQIRLGSGNKSTKWRENCVWECDRLVIEAWVRVYFALLLVTRVPKSLGFVNFIFWASVAGTKRPPPTW